MPSGVSFQKIAYMVFHLGPLLFSTVFGGIYSVELSLAFATFSVTSTPVTDKVLFFSYVVDFLSFASGMTIIYFGLCFSEIWFNFISIWKCQQNFLLCAGSFNFGINFYLFHLFTQWFRVLQFMFRYQRSKSLAILASACACATFNEHLLEQLDLELLQLLHETLLANPIFDTIH